MDYFKELLESYSKLKKRTFKLQYITEQEEVEGRGDPTAAKAFFDAADPQRDPAKFDAAIQSKQPYAYAKENGKISITGGPLGTGYTKESGSWEELLQVDPKNATKLINFFDQQSTEGAMMGAQQAEADRITALNTPGSLVDSPEYAERFPQTSDDPGHEEEYLSSEALRTALTNAAGDLKKLCQERIFSTLGGDEEYNICNRKGVPSSRYIGGTSNYSLEHKLVNGQSIQVDETGNLQEAVINTELLAQVAESNEWLVNILGKDSADWNQDDCVLAGRKMRPTTGGRVIIFGEDDVGEEPQMLPGGGVDQEEEIQEWRNKTPSTGVAISKGPLQRAMLQKIQSQCGELEAVTPEGTASYNQIKGIFNEDFLGWMINIRFQMESAGDDPTATSEAQQNAVATLQELIGKQVSDLEHIAALNEIDTAVDIGDLKTIEAAIGQLDILRDKKQLRNFLKLIARKNTALISLSGAKSTIGMGTAQTTGGKVDNYLFYGKDSAAAEKFANILDEDQDTPVVTIKSPAQLIKDAAPDKQQNIINKLITEGFDPNSETEQVHLIGLGQKLIQKNRIKVGETLYDRMLRLVAGEDLEGTAGGAGVAGGALYQRALTKTHGLTGAREEELRTYAEARIADDKLIDNGLTQGFAAWLKGNKIVSTSPEQIATDIADQFGASMPLPRKPTSLDPISNTILEYDPKTEKYELRDMKGNYPEAKKNRARLAESLKRVRLMTRIASDREAAKKDGATPAQVKEAQAAEDMLVRMGIQVGMNMGELVQVVIREGEKEDTIAFNQNDLVRGLANAQKTAGRLEIIQSGDSNTTTFKFKTKSGCEVKYTTNLERRSGSDVAAVVGKIDPTSAQCFESSKLKTQKSAVSKDPEPIASETIYKFLKGQHQLLEDLLN